MQSQLELYKDKAKLCNLRFICCESSGAYRFNASFYGLTDMPAEFPKSNGLHNNNSS